MRFGRVRRQTEGMAVCLRGAAMPTARSAAHGLGNGIAGSLGIRGRDLSSLGAFSMPAALDLASRFRCDEARRRSLSMAGVSEQEQASGETATEELRTSGQDPRVPGTTIAGFLGSGKTTFLNPIIHGLLHGSRCWASEYPYHIRPAMAFPHGCKGLSSLSDQFSDEESSDEEGIVLRMDKVAIDEDELAIASLGVSNAIVDALSKRGITQLFPIQRAVLEPAMKGRDLIARAKTGTGKTLAFGIPIIRHLVDEDEQLRRPGQFGRPPRALVLAPTRELAKQVEKEFMESAPMLSTICVYGGVSVQMQQRQLQSGVDIAVGTPGRIIDLIERGLLQLQNVHFLVLDEADQMLAVGFEEDVERILEQLPAKRQGMLFSATMPKWVKQLSRKYLNNPLTIDLVGDSNQKLAEGIRNLAISIPASAKRSILSDLIMVHGKGGKAIVFTQTKRDADEVAAAMGNLVSCGALHGDITQMQREKTLNAFRDGRIHVLVATDVAARGLDVPNVDLIIHYEIPNDSETFVHRSGRTGRAGRTGTNILMYSDQQIRTMRTIEKDVGCKFEQIGAPHVKDVMRASSEQVTHAIKVVNPNLANEFLTTAETLLKEQGTNAFAAALAHMSGFSQLPSSRSLLSHEPVGFQQLRCMHNEIGGLGMTTVRLTRTGGHSAQPLSARVVNGLLSSISRRAADKVGKICIIDDPKVEGAVFDVPEDVAKELVTKQGNPGDVFELVQKLPKLHIDEGRVRSGDMFGRFSQEGGRSNTRGGSLDRGTRDGNRGDRFGKFSSERSSDRFGKFSSGGSSDRGDRGRTFSGTCHVCNQPGHKASDCPSGRNRGGGGWGR